MRIPSLNLMFLLLVVFSASITAKSLPESEHTETDSESTANNTADLFSASPDIFRLGPSRFPKPTELLPKPNAVPVVQPLSGRHRSNQDAVFAYAEGYGIEYYLLFVESLRSTGFDGDVVLAIAQVDLLHDNVLDYLSQQPHVVVYESKLFCYDSSNQPAPRSIKRGSMDIFQMCRLNHVYGWVNDDDNRTVVETAEDPRTGRVVATLRYEWYWIWAQHYESQTWIMLLDARDSFFQQNPFQDLPRSFSNPKTSGILYLFGENTEATRLGRSTKNVNWLRNAYGGSVLQALKDKPTICSGSTMGEQIAIDEYLKAMVNEWDETDIRMTGADQGFHNYLYYSNKLLHAETIEKVIVWEQGKGIINNLGALRKKPLSEWGTVYNNVTHTVHNWDGSLSPVAHQWDRDSDLFHYYSRTRMRELKNEYQRKQRKLQQ